MNKDENKKTEQVETKEVKETAVQDEKKPAKKVKTGVITNCEQLYVRATPKREAGNILGDISKGTEVTIEEDLGEFCKVVTDKGLHGFCMSEFIDKK